MKHKHAHLIHAWADGAEIQAQDSGSGFWHDMPMPAWNVDVKYRIKPDPPRDPHVAWWGDGQRTGLYHDEDVAKEYCSLVVPLIEAGWCKMVTHNGSDQCPVDRTVNVGYETDSGNHGITVAGLLNWSDVTHYAAILPVEG